MNEIVNFICIFVSSMLLNTFCLYFCYSLLDKKFSLKEISNWLIILFLTIIAILLNNFCPQPYRFIMSFIFLIWIICWFLKEDLVKSIIVVIFFEINIIFSELIFSIATSPIIKNYESVIVVSISNVFVLLIFYLILKTKIPKKVFDKIIEISETLRKKEVVIYSIMIIIIIIVSTMESYMKLPLQIVLTTNILMALGFIGIIIKLATTKGNLHIISNKYQTSINSLKEYE